MPLYSPGQPKLDGKDTQPPSAVRDCVLPIGMGGGYFAYFVSKIYTDLLHATASRGLIVLTIALIAAALVFRNHLHVAPAQRWRPLFTSAR